MTKASCHPDRKHLARGLCRQCYHRNYKADPVRHEKVKAAAREWMQRNRLSKPDMYKERDRQRYLANPAKKRDAARRWAAANPGRVKQQARRWYTENAEKIRARDFKKRYGVDVSTLDLLLDLQGGTCRLCPRSAGLVVDHDHVTGHVRGLLCQQCNMGLGLFQDDPALLQRAIDYLMPHIKLRSEVRRDTSGV